MRTPSLRHRLSLLASMVLLSVSGAAHAADTHLATEGDRLGDAEVTAVVIHPEFHRYEARLPDGRTLPLEVTLARPDSSPSCTHHGLSVYPRWELLLAPGPGGELELDPAGEPAAEALCQRLEAHTGALGIGKLQQGDDEALQGPQEHLVGPGKRDEHAAHPLQGVLLLLGIALIAVGGGPLRRGLMQLSRPERLDGLVVALVTVGARWLWSPWGLQLAPDAGYERLYLAWGLDNPHPLYGDGYASLHGALQQATGFDPQMVFGLHFALSCLAPVVLYALARAVLRDRAGALVAGLGLALLPVALRLAASEVAHVPLATFSLLAVAGAWGFLRSGAPSLALLSATAAGFAAHLRPEALPAGLLPLGLLALGAWRHRADPARGVVGLLCGVGLLGLLGWRLATLPPIEADGPVRLSMWALSGSWRALVRPLWQYPVSVQGLWQVFLHAGLTSPLLPLLVLVGLLSGTALHGRVRLAAGSREVIGVAAIWWALALLPIFPKSWPMMDAWRLQLSAQAPLLLLAGAGTAALPVGWARWGAVILVAASSLLYLPRVTMTWAGQVEWALLQRAVTQLPAEAVVLVPDQEKHGLKVAQVGALLTERLDKPDVQWMSMSPFVARPAPGPDRFAWINLTCRIATLPGMHVPNDAAVNACLKLEQACTLTPFLTETLPDTHDVDITFAALPAEVGLYRVDDCHPPGE